MYRSDVVGSFYPFHTPLNIYFFLVYTKPETSYAPPQPNEAVAAAPTTEQDEYGVPSGDLVPLGSYFVAPPQEFILSNWKMIIIAFLGSNL